MSPSPPAAPTRGDALPVPAQRRSSPSADPTPAEHWLHMTELERRLEAYLLIARRISPR